MVSANSVLRSDFPEDNKLIVGKSYSGKTVSFKPRAYGGLHRIVGNNIMYIANLMALEEWYIHVRRPFLESLEFGQLIYAGLLDKLALAKKERIKRLQVLAEKVKMTSENEKERGPGISGRNEFYERFPEIEGLFVDGIKNIAVEKCRDDFLSVSDRLRSEKGANYIAVIQGLPAHVSEKGVTWLEKIVDTFCEQAKAIMPSLKIFA